MRNTSLMKLYVILAVTISLGFFSCNGNEPQKTVNQTDSAKTMARKAAYWETALPDEQGVDSGLLLEMLQEIKRKELNIRSIIIVRFNRLVFESYIYPYNRDISHNNKSASKSIISAMVGIALREKWIKNLDQTVAELFPGHFAGVTDERKKAITLRHLLTMTAGLNVGDQGPEAESIYVSPDPVKTALQYPMAASPGERFNYSTTNLLLMSAILNKATGKTLTELADTYLFQPMGIDHVYWKRRSEYYDFTDAYLRPIDMAKFGVLFRNGGVWKGKQVVPADWVAQSIKNHMKGVAGAEDKYGYWWWGNDYDRWQSLEEDVFMALGWGGQIIMVMPARKAVVVTTASDFGDALSMIDRYIQLAIKPEATMPVNREKVDALQEMVKHMQSPAAFDLQPVAPLPAIAKKISGVTYTFPQPNPADIIAMTFHFKDNAANTCTLTFEHVKGKYDLEIGLDNRYRISDSGRYAERLNGNTMALKGKWIDNDTFFLDFHSIGRAEQVYMNFAFKGDEMVVELEVIGAGIKFPLTAKRENVN